MKRNRDVPDDFGVTRGDLLQDLADIVEVVIIKYTKIRASNKDRQAWGRLVVSAVSEMGKILKDGDLDDLKREVEELRRLVDNKGH